jgi:hypothetical protein
MKGSNMKSIKDKIGDLIKFDVHDHEQATDIHDQIIESVRGKQVLIDSLDIYFELKWLFDSGSIIRNIGGSYEINNE